jgi:hypothetical protein
LVQSTGSTRRHIPEDGIQDILCQINPSHTCIAHSGLYKIRIVTYRGP